MPGSLLGLIPTPLKLQAADERQPVTFNGDTVISLLHGVRAWKKWVEWQRAWWCKTTYCRRSRCWLGFAVVGGWGIGVS